MLYVFYRNIPSCTDPLIVVYLSIIINKLIMTNSFGELSGINPQHLISRTAMEKYCDSLSENLKNLTWGNASVNARLAKSIAEKAFSKKVDRAGIPYIEHLTTVASLASCDLINPSKIEVIGLLHDILEDCPEWTEGALRNLFSDEVVDVVVILTKLKGENYEDYIGRVLKNRYARIVKKADLEHNMDWTRLPDITDKDIERTKKYHKAYNRILAYEKELKDNQ